MTQYLLFLGDNLMFLGERLMIRISDPPSPPFTIVLESGRKSLSLTS